MIYLGSAYSAIDSVVRERRYLLAIEAAAILAKHKLPCYVPIASWHVVATLHALPSDHLFWQAQDQAMMDRCDEGWFLMMDGGRESLGILTEIHYFLRHRKPVAHVYNLSDLDYMCQTYVPA